MKNTIIVSVLVLFLFSVSVIRAETKSADAREIVKKMDELYRSSSSEVTMEMKIVTPHWKRTLSMKAWSIGMKKTFIRILSPKKEKGIATLRIGNEMWNFLPKTNKVMKIPPSMMMGSWMGSDFTNDDLVKEFTLIDDYTFELTEVENPEAGAVYVKCIPNEGLPIVWGHIIIAVKENGYLPVWQKYYDEKGKLMREMFFKEIKTFGKRTIPAVMELTPSHKEGYKTVVRYVEAKFDTKVDKGIFSLRNLRTRI
ncbi:MAG: outer membrane lipoprotein-sorting protein [bacterium]|nr:outer membrane lipoprotein-sorting protein [bacterium]